MMCLKLVYFAAFLITSNKSLLPTWVPRRMIGQAASRSISRNQKNRNCLQTSFFDTHKSFLGVSSDGEDSDASSAASDQGLETPVLYFAERIANTLGNSNEDGRVGEGSQPENDDDNDDDKIEKDSLEEKILSEKELQSREWREKTVESIENIFVGKNNRMGAITDGFSISRMDPMLCSLQKILVLF